MRRALFLPLVLLLALAPLAADTYDLILTAVKYGAQGGIPDPMFELEILNAANAYIGPSGDAEIPDAARGEARKAFSWQAAGNVFGACALAFTAGPLVRVADEGGQAVEGGTAIPFTMTFESSTTKVGNFSITFGGAPREVDDFVVGPHRFGYSDNLATDLAKLKIERTVGADHMDNTGEATAAITYNMSTYSTVVKVVNGDPVGSGDPDYPTVCNHWNRAGTAFVKLAIAESGGSVVYEADSSPVADGHYESTVTVEITAT